MWGFTSSEIVRIHIGTLLKFDLLPRIMTEFANHLSSIKEEVHGKKLSSNTAKDVVCLILRLNIC